jgi:hypothetical protein
MTRPRLSRRAFVVGALAMSSASSALAQFPPPGDVFNPFKGGSTPEGYHPQNLRCASDSPPTRCTARLPLSEVKAIQDTQHQSEWCWAASVQMIFAYHGLKVSQSRIVEETFGKIANIPAATPALMSALNRDWTSDAGKRFTSSVDELYSVDLRSDSLNNYDAIQLLVKDKPLLYCNLSHAMVLSEISFRAVAGETPKVTAVRVIDPWPGKGLRSLSLQEMVGAHAGGQMRLVASIDVEEA